MKKFLKISIIFIILGYFTSIYIFNNKNTKYYFLQEGIYSNENDLKSSLIDVRQKVIDKEKNNYYVYLGITKSEIIANRIKDIYKNKHINTKIIEKYITNDEFSNNVDQFDLLINNTDNNDEVITVEEVILANYEEIIKNNKD